MPELSAGNPFNLRLDLVPARKCWSRLVRFLGGSEGSRSRNGNVKTAKVTAKMFVKSLNIPPLSIELNHKVFKHKGRHLKIVLIGR